MKHLGSSKKKPNNDEQKDDDEEGDNAGGWTGTMVKPTASMKKDQSKDLAASAASAKDKKESKTSDKDGSFSQYYKTGKQLEVNEKSSLVDLRKALITLNKAYERELTELDAFYSEKRKQLQAIITAKEKTEQAKKK